MKFINIIKFAELTRTAAEAAKALKCDVGQIAKSIIFKAENGDPVLVVASGRNRIDEQMIEKLGGQKITKADADFVYHHTGYVIGGVPPWGHKSKMVTFIDKDLEMFDQIYAAAGKNNAVFGLTFDALVRETGGTVAVISSSK